MSVVEFDPSWQAIGGLNGGYVLAALLRDAEALAGRTVAAASVHFHAPAEGGPATVTAAITRSGRTGTSVDVALEQTGRLRTSAKLLCVDRPASPGLTQFLPHPQVPGPDGLEPLPDFAVVPFRAHLEYRPIGPSPLSGAAEPVLRCWVRLRTPANYDVGVSAIFLDALPPSLFATLTEFRPIPTVELTAHLVPGAVGSEWMLLHQYCVWSTEDLCVDEANLYADDGRLVAQMRQIRRLLPG